MMKDKRYIVIFIAPGLYIRRFDFDYLNGINFYELLREAGKSKFALFANSAPIRKKTTTDLQLLLQKLHWNIIAYQGNLDRRYFCACARIGVLIHFL